MTTTTAPTERDDRPRTRARRVDSYLLGYLMGPAAFALILVVREIGLVAHVGTLTWLAVFLAIPATSLLADIACRRRPTLARMRTRIALHCAAVTVVIYLSGWGPVLAMAYVFVALENMAHDGSWTWRTTLAGSVVGIAAGWVAIAVGWVPSFLSVGDAGAISVLGVFCLIFVIRMAGMAFERKECAEARMQESEDRFRSLVQHSSDLTVVIDDGRVTYASPASLSLLGLEPDAVHGREFLELVHDEDRHVVATRLTDDDVDVTVEAIEFRVRHHDGAWRHAEAIITDLRRRSAVGGWVVNVRETTERKEAERLLAHQALHDPLTGLANRKLIHDRAEAMLVRSARTGTRVAALYVDLDNFKEINDSLGHTAGDQLLVAVADRLRSVVRGSDSVGRLGGDEFVVVADDVEVVGAPELLAGRLLHSLREPIPIDGVTAPVGVTASIGIATSSAGTAIALFRDADVALYRAKAAGKDGWVEFEPEMHTAAADRLELKLDLRGALERDELYLLYQPLFDLATTEVYGAEALLRWRHPVRGVVGPNEFVPMLEETGLVVEVGRWVLAEACRQGAAWAAAGHPLTLSVNVSMRQLDSPALVDDVRAALGASGLPASSLVLEVTETALMRDPDAVTERLRALKALGVGIAVDDFGTGYSSLGYLQLFPVDVLKIDRSFVAALGESEEATVLVRTMVALGRALGLGTFAEGIEDLTQLACLRAEGCEHGQGYLVSRPVEPDELLAVLAARAAAPAAS